MISVTDAKNIVGKNVVALETVRLPLLQAMGKVLAEDVQAQFNIPAFPQSSMDGYAFNFNEWKKNKELLLDGEIAAGSNENIVLAPGKAIRIFTGAPVPAGADTVIMQEKVRTDIHKDSAKYLVIEDENIEQGASVRTEGSEIKAGELALEKNTILTAPAIGFLAGIGISEVTVFPHPSISIIITGRELQQPGQSLDHGQVYESSSFALRAVLQQLHIDDVKTLYVDDDLELLTGLLKKALSLSDVVLITGGISAGDYDFTQRAAENCGVVKLFHKVKQRPGKPLYFGRRDNKLVFGLPGNPSSVLTCFYQYVLVALEALTKKKMVLQKIQAPLSKPFRKAAGLTHFLKGYYNGESVTILGAQESYRLYSFAKANCLVKIDEDRVECKQGEMMEVHLLPDFRSSQVEIRKSRASL